MPGNILVPIALLSWPLIVMMLFKKRGPQQAIVISFVAGWMFLPVANYDIFLLRNTKTAAICYSIIGCAYFLDKERLLTFKFNAADLPMVLWCTAPFFSAIANSFSAQSLGMTNCFKLSES